MAPRIPETSIWLVALSYALALLINVAPISRDLALLLPPFGLLVLFYWAQNDLRHTHFLSATLIGLLYDALYNTLMGLHALLFSILLFIFLRMRLRFRLVRPLQQAGAIVGLLYLYQLMQLISLYDRLAAKQWMPYLAMPLSTLLLWPLLKRLMDWLTNTPIQHR